MRVLDRKRAGKKVRRGRLIRPISPSVYDAGYDHGFDTGYNKGYDDGHCKAGNANYEKGLYDGGEAWIDQMLPEDCILPDLSVAQIMEAGLRQLEPQCIRLLSSSEVAAAFHTALDDHQPLSLVRIGDGELLTLCQETVLSSDEVRRRGDFLHYAGVHVPDLAARDQLAAAIRNASIVGVPKRRLKNFQPLLVPALKAFGMDCRSLRLTLSTINYNLFYDGYFVQFMKGRNVLVIGNHAQSVAAQLKKHGFGAIGFISPVDGMNDITRVMNLVREIDFDLAIVSAGVAAVPIVQRIGIELGKVALDFGHMADFIANGQADFPQQ